MGPTDRAARVTARRQRRAAVTDPDTVMAAGAALLASRPWSVADMRGRLVALGYPAPLVETVVSRLIVLGYLDDERYAAAWVASRDRARPRGSMALRRELRRKGIDPAVIDAALAGREPAVPEGEASDHDTATSADLVAASRLLDRRQTALAREPDPRKRRQKAYALLARHGFDPEVCARAIVLASTNDERPATGRARFAGDPVQD
jgi:regulatory protein